MILHEFIFLNQVYQFGAKLLIHSKFWGWVSLQQEITHNAINQLNQNTFMIIQTYFLCTQKNL